MPNVTAPRHKTIAGQPHQLSYINKFESELLKAIGGAGVPTGKQKIPSYFFGLFDSNRPTSGGDATGTLGGIGTDIKKSFTSKDDWDYNESYEDYQTRTQDTADKHRDFMKGEGIYSFIDRNGNDNKNNKVDKGPDPNIGLADDYNTAIEDLNTKFADFSDQLGNLDNIGDLTYVDYYGDTVGDVQDDLSGLNDLLAEIEAIDTPDMPDFTGDFTGDLADLPDFGALKDTITGLIESGEGLADERAEKEKAYNALADSLGLDLDQLDRSLDRLGITDTRALADLEDDFYRLTGEAELIAKNDPLYDQLGFNLNDRGISNEINSIRAARAAEQQRISNFAKDLLRDYGLYGDELEGLNITNLDELNALATKIDNRVRDARYFDSDLGFNFSREIDDLKALGVDVDNLLRDREDEFDRISKAEADALATAQMLDRAGDITGIYDLADINDLQAAIDAANAGITGFSSLLPYDFSATADPLSAAQSDVTDLLTARGSALDLIETPITGLTDDLAGLDLYDEQGMRDIDNRLSNLGIDLTSYTGGRVTGIQNKINLAMGAVDDRIRELENYRNDIETQAQALQEEFDNANFYTLDDLTDPEARLEAQKKEADLYNALQALDEITATTTRLAEERARLEQDAANVAAREGAGTDMVLDQIQGQALINPELITPEMLGGLSLEEYLAMLGSGEEEENVVNPVGTFGQNVVVGA